MRQIMIALFGVAILALTTGDATARDGCGRGFYWNGYACVPQYGPHYFGPPPGYGYRRYDQPIYGESSFGRPEVWFRPHFDRYGRPYCVQRGYTVQDGVCKRYRGY